MTEETQEAEVIESSEQDTGSDESESTQDNEQDSTSEGEGETEAESTKQRQPETPEAKRARLKRQLNQHNKKHGFKDEDSGDKSEKGSEAYKERFDRQDLKLAGITDKKEQDIVIDYANWKDISVEEAAKKPSVKAELEALRSKSSVPKPSTRNSSGASDSVEYWRGQVKKGNFPKDAEMLRKLRKEGIFRT